MRVTENDWQIPNWVHLLGTRSNGNTDMSVDLQISAPPKLNSTLSHQSTDKNLERPILPRVAMGDSEAIEKCLDRFGGLVWSLARRSCPDEQAAEDAVQDIFVQVWQSAKKFDESLSSETTFVAMIARRRLIDRYRKTNTKAQAMPAESDSFVDMTDESPGVEANLEQQDEVRRAEKFLSKLPRKQRDVIRMSIYDGVSHSRIAELTGLSLGTVKTNIRRGLADLRRQLFATDPEIGRSA
jgi:RNA polymerase sigma-70 factor (ECF subfamily)